MKNSESPAMPLTGDAYEDLVGNKYADGGYEHGMGLTKREYYAGLAMQALLSNGQGINSMPALAVKAADDLLQEMEK